MVDFMKFNGKPLVAGKLRGFRYFRDLSVGSKIFASRHSRQAVKDISAEDYDAIGVYSVTMPFRYTSGENVAACTWSRSGFKSETQVAKKDCICGFYAFYNHYSSHTGAGLVGNEPLAGIVDAYGTITMGTLGFRAEKLKIVAVATRSWLYCNGLFSPHINDSLKNQGFQVYPDVQSMLREYGSSFSSVKELLS